MKKAAYFFTNGQSVRASGGYRGPRTYLSVESVETEIIKTLRIEFLDEKKEHARGNLGKEFRKGLFAPVMIDGQISFFTANYMKQDNYGGVRLSGIINDSILTSFHPSSIKNLDSNTGVCYETVTDEIILPDDVNGIKIIKKRKGVNEDRYDQLALCILDLDRNHIEISPESFLIVNENGEYVIDKEYMAIFENVVKRNLSCKDIPVYIVKLGSDKGPGLSDKEISKFARENIMLPLKEKIALKKKELAKQKRSSSVKK